MTRGYLVNEFKEKVGVYNINHKNEYYVELYHQPRGYMTEKQLKNYADILEVEFEEVRVLVNKSGKAYGVK